MNFQKKLVACAAINNSWLCVGLDSDLSKIPSHLQQHSEAQFEFLSSSPSNKYSSAIFFVFSSILMCLDLYDFSNIFVKLV